jgi:hypothetical protein
VSGDRGGPLTGKNESMVMLISHDLTVKGEPVPFDVGVAIIVDTILGLGFIPATNNWQREIEGGWRYSWQHAS